MRKQTFAAMAFCVMSLSACMTQQQGTSFQESLLRGVAQGLLAGGSANLGQGIALNNKRLITVGAAQLAAGTLVEAGAEAARQTAPPRPVPDNARNFAPNTASARPGLALGPHDLPDTPECRYLDSLIRNARSWSQLPALRRAEEACRRSAYRARGVISGSNCRMPNGRPGRLFSDPRTGRRFCVPLWMPGDPVPQNATILSGR